MATATVFDIELHDVETVEVSSDSDNEIEITEVNIRFPNFFSIIWFM